MKHTIGRVFIGLGVLLMAQIALATTATGPVNKLRIGTGDSPARMSIQITGAITACPVAGWYAYEEADTGLGLVMTNALRSAYETGQPVQLVGTSTCDRFGVESVSYIDVIRNVP